MQYVCDVCGWHRPRLRSVQDHCATKKVADTHPLGRDTPISRREMPDPHECDCNACLTEAGVMRREDDRSVQVAELSRLMRELTALTAALNRSAPSYMFGHEPVPGLRGLRNKLLDVFAGNVVAHLVWTHVHSCANVRASRTREGCLRVYGSHGWYTVPADRVASSSLDGFQARLERMWLAMKKHDARAATALMPALRKFAKTAVVELDADVFGLVESSSQDLVARGETERELELSLLEYATDG